MTRIGRLFESLKQENRKGLIAYLTAGDPSPRLPPWYLPWCAAAPT